MKVYCEPDLEHNVLSQSVVAVIGFGNQGHAHALNLRDSGVEVVVGARPGGKGWKEAKRGGFATLPIGEACVRADLVMVLLPDEIQGRVFAAEIRGNLKPNAAVGFAHGFSVTFGQISPPPGHDVILVAPKGQGHFLRKRYLEGKGLPCLVAVEQDASGQALAKALSYASSLGCLRAGALAVSFREEAITDLFGEQAVLCGGVPELVRSAFDVLVQRGYQPEVAYIECLQELMIITDLMQRKGIAGMRTGISPTAAWGSLEAGPRVVTARVRAELESILDDVESGRFACRWLEEADRGKLELSRRLAGEEKHPIEEAGRRVRALMGYIEDEESR